MSLVNKNAAILIKDIEAKDVLIKRTIELINDPKEQEDLKRNMKQLAFSDSANMIAKEVLKLAGYTL